MKLIYIPLTIIATLMIAITVFLIQTKDLSFNRNINEAQQEVENISNVQTKSYEGNVFINNTYQLRFKLNKTENVSALATRISIPVELLSVAPTINLNPDLVNADWLFPIKQVYLKNNQYIIDLAAVNVSPEGFNLESEIFIATLEFHADKPDSSSFIIDSEQTKLIRKNGSELNIEF